MQWEFIVALVVAVPIILFPAAYVWYLNAGGIYTSLKKAMARRRVQREKAPVDNNWKTSGGNDAGGG